jgi:opacity protein-like surface antigen
MFKKTATYAALLTTITAVPTMAHSNFYKSGFLAGGHVGAGFGSGKFTGTFSTPNPTITGSGSARKTSPLFGVLAAYRHISPDGFAYGLGLEFNFYGSNEISKQIPLVAFGQTFNFNNRLKRNYSVTPALTLGKVFCGRFYAGLGLGMPITRFKQSYNGGVVPIAGQSSQTKVGFSPSIALEYALTNNVSLTGNVSYETYGRLNKTFATPAVAAGATYITSVKPSYVNVKIGATYRF